MLLFLVGIPTDLGPKELGQVRALISRLNTVLTAEDVQAEKEREIKKRIADVQLQLEPFEEVFALSTYQYNMWFLIPVPKGIGMDQVHRATRFRRIHGICDLFCDFRLLNLVDDST